MHLDKKIEGLLITAIVYIENGNPRAAVEQIGEAVKVLEYDRLKESKKNPTMVRQRKDGDRRARKSTR